MRQQNCENRPNLTPETTKTHWNHALTISWHIITWFTNSDCCIEERTEFAVFRPLQSTTVASGSLPCSRQLSPAALKELTSPQNRKCYIPLKVSCADCILFNNQKLTHANVCHFVFKIQELKTDFLSWTFCKNVTQTGDMSMGSTRDGTDDERDRCRGQMMNSWLIDCFKSS